MQKGLSMIEMIITMAVVAIMIVTVFQIFLTIHSTLSKSNARMTDYTEIRYEITNLWRPGGVNGYGLEVSEDGSFFDRLAAEGVSSDLLEKLESAITIMNVQDSSREATFTAVMQK
ncbi:prepilin-type N-terminal cleavage/methylation domain-containing protein [uncultured Mesotoga sp.]|jgi:prepilin-type N-terminal cleavage/methylation domain-containing protein|uniref:prepilin-type N-terminal cleavage/methylation domain-containing protein n=1 Tax=uncultured Mesotoga sp. TaxID=1184400 RepID=UPI00259344FD|nr:prepilin-type N-terminal cleavage/methylation domain-containing protein [uncultured Mesotoga sp.]